MIYAINTRAALLLATEGCEAAHIKEQWLTAIDELLLLQFYRENVTVRTYHRRGQAARPDFHDRAAGMTEKS